MHDSELDAIVMDMLFATKTAETSSNRLQLTTTFVKESRNPETFTAPLLSTTNADVVVVLLTNETRTETLFWDGALMRTVWLSCDPFTVPFSIRSITFDTDVAATYRLVYAAELTKCVMFVRVQLTKTFVTTYEGDAFGQVMRKPLVMVVSANDEENLLRVVATVAEGPKLIHASWSVHVRLLRDTTSVVSFTAPV